MANLGAHIAGGLLSGFGQGLAAQAEETGRERRERALMEMRRQADAEDRTFRREEATEDRKFRLELEEKRTESERGLLGQRQGFERAEAERERTFRASEARTAREHELGVERIKAQGRSADQPSWSDREKAIEIILNDYSETDAVGNLVNTDYAAAADALEREGLKSDAARMRQKAAKIESAAREGNARAQAEAELDAERGWFESVTEEQVKARTQQIMAGRNSSTPRDPGGTVEAGPGPAQPLGSRENPHKDLTREEIAKLPKGSWVMVNGKLGQRK